MSISILSEQSISILGEQSISILGEQSISILGEQSISIPLLQLEEGCPKGGVVGEKRAPYSYDS